MNDYNYKIYRQGKYSILDSEVFCHGLNIVLKFLPKDLRSKTLVMQIKGIR